MILEIYLLISSQCDFIMWLGISAVALIAKTTRNDPSIWSDVEKKIFSYFSFSQNSAIKWLCVLALNFATKKYHVLLLPGIHCCRWNAFDIGLANIRKKYNNIGNLKIVFADVFGIALSATITQGMPKYIRKSFFLRSLIHLYKKTLDQLNIIYIV